MATRLKYKLDVGEMYKEKEILEKKRDEALQKWKEYMKSFNGGKYDRDLQDKYLCYYFTVTSLERGINDKFPISKQIDYFWE
jgi:hypothetical protein